MNDQEEQYAVERLLEDESLTANLIDPAARLLLEWGAQQARTIVQQTRGAAKEQTRRLTALHHTLKNIACQVGQSPPDQQAERVHIFLQTIAAFMPQKEPPSAKTRDST